MRILTFQSPVVEKIARALYNDTEEATYMAFDLIFEHKVCTIAVFFILMFHFQ